MEQLAWRSGVKLLHVPYKGFAEGIHGLLGGHVMAYSDSTGWGPQVDAGALADFWRPTEQSAHVGGHKYQHCRSSATKHSLRHPTALAARKEWTQT